MKTVDCDWLKDKNEKAHHTDEYETDLMVIRRGQTFTTKMTFDRKFHNKADKITLELNIGACICVFTTMNFAKLMRREIISRRQ